jgi:hypothetical protein
MGGGGTPSRKVEEQMDIESREEIENMRALRKLKRGKAAREDGITNEIVKSGVLAIVE